MVGKTPKVRKSDRDRFETIRLHCGCLPCMLMGHLDVHTTIEHVTEHGRRIDGENQHQWTIGLCMWHHFGHTPNHTTRQQMSGEVGPSLIWGRKNFEDHFGGELEVLVPAQDFLLSEFESSPWPEYTISREAVRLTRIEWTELNHAHLNR
jgi:hypothetical protein